MTAGLHSFWNLEDIHIQAFEQNMISRNTSFSWFTQLTILLKYITESFAKSKPHSPEIFDDTPACYFAVWKNVCFGRAEQCGCGCGQQLPENTSLCLSNMPVSHPCHWPPQYHQTYINMGIKLFETYVNNTSSKYDHHCPWWLINQQLEEFWKLQEI